MFELQGKKVWIPRDALGENGFEGRVERVSGKWLCIKVGDPQGVTECIWINSDLQREIQVLAD